MTKQIVDFAPLLVAACFDIIVFILAQLSRYLIGRYLNPGGSLSRFLMEAVTTAQMCACVYENAVIIRNYGPWGFFFVVSTVLLAGARMNRGAFVSPLTPIELFYHKVMPGERLLEILLGQAVGGYAAFTIARNLWYASSHLSLEHSMNYETTKCAFAYKVPFLVAFAFEFVGCFLMRMILARVPSRYKSYMGPVITSAFLTFALAFIGVVGLNPTVASSRMLGCDGLNTLWFVLTYWVCPVVGWMAAALFDDRSISGVLKTEIKKRD